MKLFGRKSVERERESNAIDKIDRLVMELDGLGYLMKAVEDAIRYRIENYKGSKLEKEKVGIYSGEHSPYFKLCSVDLVNGLLKVYKGKVYEVEGEEGVSLVVKEVGYSEPFKLEEPEEVEERGFKHPSGMLPALTIVLEVQEVNQD